MVGFWLDLCIFVLRAFRAICELATWGATLNFYERTRGEVKSIYLHLGDAGQTGVSASPKMCPFGASKKSASVAKVVCAKGEVVIAMRHIVGGESVSVAVQPVLKRES
jgi:hypothetical protein